MARIPCAVSCTREFLALVDRRAASLGLNRSAYIIQVLRQDLFSGKPNLNIVAESHGEYQVQPAPAVKRKEK